MDGHAFPRLTDENHQLTSDPDVRYNCIAWAVQDTERWWQPGFFWPIEVTWEQHGIGELVDAFKTMGFVECSDGTLEPGFEKVAFYGATFEYTHAARQLPDGKWTSKLGKAEDITHATPEDVADGLYGPVVQFMQRSIP